MQNIQNSGGSTTDFQKSKNMKSKKARGFLKLRRIIFKNNFIEIL